MFRYSSKCEDLLGGPFDFLTIKAISLIVLWRQVVGMGWGAGLHGDSDPVYEAIAQPFTTSCG